MFSQSLSQNSYYNPKPPAFYPSQSNQRNNYPNNTYYCNDMSDARTCSDTQSQLSYTRKRPAEELSSMLLAVIENTIPKIADQCAGILIQRLIPCLEKQTQEMDLISSEIGILKKDCKEAEEKVERAWSQEKEQIDNRFTRISKEYQAKKSVFKDQLIKEIEKFKENSDGTLDTVKQKLVEVNDQLSNDISSNQENLTKSLNENKANVILLKRKIDEKITPLKIALSQLSDNQIEKTFTEDDLLLLKGITSKFDHIYEAISKFSNERKGVQKQKQLIKIDSNSMIIDDFSTDFCSTGLQTDSNSKHINKINKLKKLCHNFPNKFF
jgi:hypothetical protein